MKKKIIFGILGILLLGIVTAVTVGQIISQAQLDGIDVDGLPKSYFQCSKVILGEDTTRDYLIMDGAIRKYQRQAVCLDLIPKLIRNQTNPLQFIIVEGEYEVVNTTFSYQMDWGRIMNMVDIADSDLNDNFTRSDVGDFVNSEFRKDFNDDLRILREKIKRYQNQDDDDTDIQIDFDL